jgi:hypothetical protein
MPIYESTSGLHSPDKAVRVSRRYALVEVSNKKVLLSGGHCQHKRLVLNILPYTPETAVKTEAVMGNFSLSSVWKS